VNSQILRKVDDEVGRDPQAATRARVKRAPLPRRVLRIQLHVSLQDGQQGDYGHQKKHIEEQKAEHGVNMVTEDAVDHVAKLGINARKLDQAEDRCHNNDVQVVWLSWSGPTDFIDLCGLRCGRQEVALVGASEAESAIEQVPAKRSEHNLEGIVAQG